MENLINASNQQITSLIKCLELSQSIQKEIKDYVYKLDVMTKGLDECIPESYIKN
jgi:hypothetical protein